MVALFDTILLCIHPSVILVGRVGSPPEWSTQGAQQVLLPQPKILDIDEQCLMAYAQRNSLLCPLEN